MPLEPAARKYAEIVAITVVGMFISGIGFLWLITEFRSSDGLSSSDIGLLVATVVNALTLAGVWKLGSQNRDIETNVNGDRQLRSIHEHLDDQDAFHEGKDDKE